MILRHKAGTVTWSAVAQIVCLSIVAAAARAQSVYPQGSGFPLQVYSLQPDADVPGVAANGWNIGHRYGWNEVSDPLVGEDSLNALMQTFSQNGMQGLPHLPAYHDTTLGVWTEWAQNDMGNWIAAIAPNTNIAYWDLPEEQRYWKPTEFQIVQDYTAWTRVYDPQQRPNYMYIPTHYTQDQVSNYVPYLDVVPASAYADFAGQPHAWVRWRMEETVRGIQLAGTKLERTAAGSIGNHWQRTWKRDFVRAALQWSDRISAVRSEPDGFIHTGWVLHSRPVPIDPSDGKPVEWEHLHHRSELNRPTCDCQRFEPAGDVSRFSYCDVRITHRTNLR